MIRRPTPCLACGEMLGTGRDRAGLRLACRGHEDACGARRDQFTLNGKAPITNAGVGGVAVVKAVTFAQQKGISAFILDKACWASAGRPYRKLQLRLEYGGVDLDNVRYPQGSSVRAPMGLPTPCRLEGGVAMAAMAAGIARRARRGPQVHEAAERLRPDAGGVQRAVGMIADYRWEVEAARLLTLRAAALKDAGRPAKVAASMAKVFASEVAMKAATKSLQIHGGAGYITEFPIERIFRDAKLTEIGEGTSEVQRMVIAREILGFR